MSRLVASLGALVLLVALALLPACGSTAAGGGDGGSGPPTCTTADPAYCDSQTNTYWWCEGGHWKTMPCASGVCIASTTGPTGCLACTPGQKYCSGQDIYQCTADGTPGDYQETCQQFELCTNGGCLSACDNLTRSNVGCEFWAVDLPNDYQCMSSDNGVSCKGMGNFPIGTTGTTASYGCGACQQFAVVITNTSDFNVSITIEQNDANPGDPISLSTVATNDVAPHALGQFDLPMREVDCTEWYTDGDGRMRRKNDTTTCLSSKAYRITSNYPIVAYQFNPIVNVYSNAASLLIPTTGLDKDYYVLGWTTANPIKMPMPGFIIEGIPDYMNMTIVGARPGTHVEITTTHPTQASPDGGIPAAGVGDTITAELGPFDVLNIESKNDLTHIGDFTGSRVTSSEPVAVFSGGQRSLVPDDTTKYNPPAPASAGDLCCTEHLEQQMFPISSLGMKYVLTRSPIRDQTNPEPDFYRIFGTKDNTNVTTNNPQFPSFTVNAGQFAKIWSTQDMTLIADQPVLIGQYIVCAQYMANPNPAGDPKFILFPSVDQHRNDYVFLTPTTFDKNYVVIAAPDGSDVTLDGSDVSGEITSICEQYPAGTIDGTNYLAIRCPVDPGPHTVTSPSRNYMFGISVYGYGNVSSYSYPGGADVKQINIE